MPVLGLGLGLDRYRQIQTFAQLVKSAGGVLYLDARKADGSLPLTGNTSPWVDLINANNGTLTNFAGNESSGWNVENPVVPYDDNNTPPTATQRIVNGFVDLPTEQVTEVEATCVVESNSIRVTTNTTGSFRRCLITEESSNTVKTLVAKARNFQGSTNPRIAIRTLADSSDLAVIDFTQTEQEFRVLFTPTDLGFGVRFYGTFITSEDGDKEYYDFAVYEGDYVTGSPPLPPSGQWVSGNSKTGALYVDRFDGVDDYVLMPDAAVLDITSAPLAIGVTFKASLGNNGYLITKNLLTFEDIQYALQIQPAGEMRFVTGGVAYGFFLLDYTKFVNVVYFWDGINITSYLNGVQQSQSAYAGPLVSSGTPLLGNRNGGSFFLEGEEATVTIYTGSDIQKILDVESKISADYLALNP